MTINEVVSHLQSSPCASILIKEFDVLPSKIIRVATQFIRSDGSNLDLFIIEEIPESGLFLISDYAQTHSFIIDNGLRIPDTNFSSLIRNFGLKERGYEISKNSSNRHIVYAIFLVGQACVALSNAGLSSDFSEQARDIAIKTTVERFASYEISKLASEVRSPSDSQRVYKSVHNALQNNSINFVQDAKIRVQRESVVSVDFLIKSDVDKAIMLVEQARYKKVLERRVDHAFAVHSDLLVSDWSGDRFTIIDSKSLSIFAMPEALSRLERVSRVIDSRDFEWFAKERL